MIGRKVIFCIFST